MANALSINYDRLVNCIQTPVTLTNIFNQQQIHSLGIWDTGATNSVITRNAAIQLGLQPVAKTIVRGVHGEKVVNVYFVKIALNNEQITLTMKVTECEELSAKHDVCMLIGMDIIKIGDFSITNFDGKTVMSFIRPSQKKVDFVEDINEYNKILKIHEVWIKKGIKKCPCGSGKSFDNCHGKIQYR